MACDGRDRDWSDTCTSQGTPTIIGNCQEVEKKHGTDSPLESSEENNTAETFISDF